MADFDYGSVLDEVNGGATHAPSAGSVDYGSILDEVNGVKTNTNSDAPVLHDSRQQGAVVGNAANQQVLMRPGDFANEPQDMGGARRAAANIAQETGADIDPTGDESLGGRILTGAEAFLMDTGAGKAYYNHMSKNAQEVMNGAKRGRDGTDTPFEQLPDEELDWALDATGFNGGLGYARRFLGSTGSKYLRGDDDVMSQWDRTVGKKFTDEAERKRARVKYAQDWARGWIEMQEGDRANAKAETEGRKEEGAGSWLVRQGIEQGGYMAPYVLGGMMGGGNVAASMALPFAVGTFNRGGEYQTDKYEMKPDGEIVVANVGDTANQAFTRGAGASLVETGVEVAGGKAATKLLGLGVGKVPFVKQIAGKVGNAAGEVVGAVAKKMEATAAGRAAIKFGRTMNLANKYTQVGSFPEEYLEEVEGDIGLAALGLDRRASENDGTSFIDRAKESGKNFFSAEQQKDLVLSLALMQLANGGAGYAMDRHAGKTAAWNRTVTDEEHAGIGGNRDFRVGDQWMRTERGVDSALEAIGVDKKELKYYTTAEKMAAFNGWASGLSEEVVTKTFQGGERAVKQLFQRVTRDAGTNRFGEVDPTAKPFNRDAEAVTTTDETGAEVIHREDGGISIDAKEGSDGEARFYVKGHGGRVRSAQSLDEAYALADQMSARGQVRDAKWETLKQMRNRFGLEGTNFVAGDTLEDALNEMHAQFVDEAVQSGIAQDEAVRMADAEVAKVRNDRNYNPNNPSFETDFGGKKWTIYALDNLGSVEDMKTAIRHEAVIHSGLDMALGGMGGNISRGEFLKRLDESGLAPEDRRVFENTIINFATESKGITKDEAKAFYDARSKDASPEVINAAKAALDKAKTAVFANESAANEVFAYTLEAVNRSPTLGQGIEAAVRGMFRKRFNGDLKFSGAELYEMLDSMRAKASEQKGGKATYRRAETREEQERVSQLAAKHRIEEETAKAIADAEYQRTMQGIADEETANEIETPSTDTTNDASRGNLAEQLVTNYPNEYAFYLQQTGMHDDMSARYGFSENFELYMDRYNQSEQAKSDQRAEKDYSERMDRVVGEVDEDMPEGKSVLKTSPEIADETRIADNLVEAYPNEYAFFLEFRKGLQSGLGNDTPSNRRLFVDCFTDVLARKQSAEVQENEAESVKRGGAAILEEMKANARGQKLLAAPKQDMTIRVGPDGKAVDGNVVPKDEARATAEATVNAKAENEFNQKANEMAKSARETNANAHADAKKKIKEAFRKPRQKPHAPNEGLGHKDYAAETGDELGAELMRLARAGGILRTPRGFSEYRRALAKWNRLSDKKKANARRPRMNDYGVVDPMADFIESLYDGDRNFRMRVIGMTTRVGGNDSIAELFPDSPEVRAMAERDGLESVVKALADAQEKYNRWREGKRAERESERNRATEDKFYDYDGLASAKDGADAEWDQVIGEIEAGVAGFGPTGEYVVPFTDANLTLAKKGDVVHFDHDEVSFDLVDYDKSGRVLTLMRDTDGVVKKFKVSENHIEEIEDGQEGEEGADAHNDGDANGEQGEAKGGIPEEVRKAGIAAQRVLKNNAALDDAGLRGFLAKAKRMHRSQLVKAAEDLLAYREAAKNVGGEREGGKYAGAEEADEETGVQWRKANPSEQSSLDREKTIRVYRAMQMIDGKLYPPMAAKVEGKLVDPAKPGEWLVADVPSEPDIKRMLENGQLEWSGKGDNKHLVFKLDKANGKSIKAAYNPYWHTSRSPLNDQFSSAYDRPNLVTVEVEVPESELTSGHKEDYAKDSVGEMTWKSGVVTGDSVKNGKPPRKVILSRYCKVVRVVPDAEVAKKIKEMLDGTDVTIPVNTVTPSLREELMKIGVPITGPRSVTDAARKRIVEDTKDVAGVQWRTVNRDLSDYDRGGVRWRKGTTVSRRAASLSRSPFPDGETEKRGAESIVYRDGDGVVKFRDARDGAKSVMDKIALFNEVFGDMGMGYDVKGVVEDDEWGGKDTDPRVEMTQAYVDAKPGSGKASREGIVDYLKGKYGAANVKVTGDVRDDGGLMRKPFTVVAGPYRISDLKDANVAVDARTGEAKAWDATIERVDGGGVRWRTAVTPEQDAAYMDAVKRGDTETARRMVRDAAIASGMDENPRSVAVKSDNAFIGQMQYLIPSMPNEVARIIASWKVKSQSPYSNSFYNSNDISWSHKPDRSLRVSDHWNFVSRGEEHCVTDIPVENGKWTVAEYHAEDGKYHVQKMYAPVESNISTQQRTQAENEYIKKAINSLLGKSVKGMRFKSGILEGVEDSDGRLYGVVKVKPSGKIIRESAYNIVMSTNVKWNKYGYALVDGAEDYQVYFDEKSGMIKSADPVTYDDNGNVIPLSQRFNPENDDIRWRRAYVPHAAAQGMADMTGIATADELADLGLSARELREKDAKRRHANETRPGVVSQIIDKNMPIIKRVKALVSNAGNEELRKVVQERFQDMHVRLRDFERKVAGALGVKVDKDKSTYYLLDRENGIRDTKWREFENTVLEKAADELSGVAKRRGMGLDDVREEFSLYAQSMHAPERNRMIAERSQIVRKVLDSNAITANDKSLINAYVNGTTVNGTEVDFKRIEDIGNDLVSRGVLDEYELAQLNHDLRGAGGKSTAWWNAKLAQYRANGMESDFANVYVMLMRTTQMARDELHEAGLLSEAQKNTWERLSEHYVPMRYDLESEYDPLEGMFMGDQDNAGGRRKLTEGESRHAFGSSGIADDVLTFAVKQYQDAINRASDNRVRRSLAEQARSNPGRFGKVVDYMTDDERAQVIRTINGMLEVQNPTQRQLAHIAKLQRRLAEARNGLPTIKVLGVNGVMHEVPDIHGMEQRANVLAFKEDGDVKFVELGGFKQADVDNGAMSDMDANKIGQALKNESSYKLDTIHRAVRGMTGRFSALRTAFTPTFIVSNAGADFRQAYTHVWASHGMKTANRFAANWLKAMGTARRFVTGKPDMTNPMDRMMAEMDQNGGRIGGLATANFKDMYDGLKKSMDRAFRHANGNHSVKDMFKAAGEFVLKANETIELTTRLAAYEAVRNAQGGNGRTTAQNIADAVSYARDVTVNFNRKGTLSTILNAYYAFFNAAMQDIQRTYQMATDPQGRQVILATFVAGLAAALIGYGQDDPEDEANGLAQWKNTQEWEKQSRFGVRVGGITAAVPIRGLVRIAFYGGQKAGDIFSAGTDPVKAATDMTGFIAGNMLDPLGDTASMAQTIAPSIVRPLVELLQNKSFSGAQIYREPSSFNPNQVRSRMGRAGTSSVFKVIAETLNKITGGTDVKRGMIDVQPEIYSKVGEWLFGTTGRDVTQTANLVTEAVQGRIPEMKALPFANRFLRNLPENSARFRQMQGEYESAVQIFRNGSESDKVDVVGDASYLDPANKAWADELKELNKAAQNLMKYEMRSESTEERDFVHQLRMRAQNAFMQRMANKPRTSAAADKAASDTRTAARKILAPMHRQDLKEKREKERERKRFRL